MKTIEDMKAMAVAPENIAGSESKDSVKDGSRDCGSLSISYPTLEFFRELPEDVQARAIRALAQLVKQHQASEQLRRGTAREDAIAAGEKDGEGKPLSPLEYTREFNLAVWLLTERKSKAGAKKEKELGEKASQLLDAVKKGGEGFWPKVKAAAKGYGYKVEGEWQAFTLEDAMGYQRAKRAHEDRQANSAL